MTTLEKNGDWKGAINLLQNGDNHSKTTYLRGIFFITYFLAEGQYSDAEYEYITLNLKDIYNKAKIKFQNDNQFQFFTAITIYIGEWYFDTDIAIVEQILKNVIELEPNNLFYKWGYYSTIDQRSNINFDMKLQLAEQLLFIDLSYITALKKMGLMGSYFIGILESTYEQLKTR